MEKELAEGSLIKGEAHNIAFKAGKLEMQITYGAGPVEAGLVVKLDSSLVLDAIAQAIPGQVDDAVINLIKSALK